MTEQDYNTGRDKLIMAEYGRNIQNMVKFAMSVENRTERNIIANAIVTVLGQINPMLRDRDEFESKLWVHLYIISDYKLDVDYPCELPTKEEVEQKPKKLSYPQSKIPYRYYGKNISILIDKVKQIEDELERKKQTLILANLMKKQYNTYNHESAEDKTIRKHLLELSEGVLSLSDTERLIQEKANKNFYVQPQKKKPIHFKKNTNPASKNNHEA